MTPKEFVTRLFERWERGDMKGLFDAISDDVRWTAIGHTSISGVYTSKAEYFEKCYRPLMARLNGPARCEVRRIIAEGNIVVVQWRGETPTHSGRPYVQEYCWVMRVAGETITGVHGYFDTAAVVELLGSS
jgi:uncharacterized protein